MSSKKNRSRRANTNASRPPANGRNTSASRNRTPRTSARQQRAAQRIRAQRRRKLVNGSLIGVGIGALAGVIALAVLSHASTAGDSTNTNSFVLPRLGGSGKVHLASFRGNPTVVNFFASWCTECAGELPIFAQDAQTLRGKVDFVEVNALESGDGLGFARSHDITPSTVTAIASDVGGSNGDGLYRVLGGTGSMPLTAFYGAGGKLITTHVGAFDASTLAAELQQLYGISVPA